MKHKVWSLHFLIIILLQKIVRKWDGPSVLSDLIHSDDDSLTTLKFRLKNGDFTYYYFANIWTRINMNALNQSPNSEPDGNGNNFQISNITLDLSQHLSFSLRLRRQCDWVFIHIIEFVRRQWKICVYARLKRISNWTSFILSKQLKQREKQTFIWKFIFSRLFGARHFEHWTLCQTIKLQKYNRKFNDNYFNGVSIFARFALKLKHIKSSDPINGIQKKGEFVALKTKMKYPEIGFFFDPKDLLNIDPNTITLSK